jgi:hypothetical protein
MFPRERENSDNGSDILFAVRADMIYRDQLAVEAGSNTSSVALRVVGGDKREVPNLRQQNMVASPTGLGPENYCAGEGQQQL